MQNNWECPLLYKWEVQLFLLQHLRFKNLTDADFEEISRQNVVPNPRGVELAAIYVHGRLDLASKLVGGIVELKYLLLLYSSFDGIHFQNLYLACKDFCSIESVASPDELVSIQKYFNLSTLNGSLVKMKM